MGYTIVILVMTATPLAMRVAGFELPDAATVIQWHVLGMFAPSFVTGRLIARFGLPNILLAGTAVLAGSVATAITGQTMAHFWLALALLGLGWNSLFVGGSALLAATHTAAERGKVQGINELVIFSAVAAESLLVGALLHTAGWATLNLLVLPLLGPPSPSPGASDSNQRLNRHLQMPPDGDQPATAADHDTDEMALVLATRQVEHLSRRPPAHRRKPTAARPTAL